MFKMKIRTFQSDPLNYGDWVLEIYEDKGDYKIHDVIDWEDGFETEEEAKRIAGHRVQQLLLEKAINKDHDVVSERPVNAEERMIWAANLAKGNMSIFKNLFKGGC